MRSVILVSVCIFIAVLAGGYSVMWYMQGMALKQSVQNSIDQLNAKQKYLTYDHLDISGFPSNLYVSIVKPHFTGRIDLLLQSLRQTPGANPPTVASAQIWNEDIIFDGRIVFGVNVFSNLFNVAYEGNVQETAQISDKTFTTLHQQVGNTTCMLKMKPDANMLNSLWNYKSLANMDAQYFFKNFRMADCSSGGNTVTDLATKEKLTSSGPVRFYVTSDEAADGYKIRVYMKTADVEVTPQGDVVLAYFIHAFSPDYPYPIVFSTYGKQNAEFDFGYTGPTEIKKGDTNPTIHIAINKFDITNSLYTSHINFLLDNATNGDSRSARLAFKVDSTFTEQYDKLVQSMLYAFLKNINSNNDPQFQQWRTQFQNYTPEQLYSIIYPSLFSLHALGNVVQAVDVSYVGSPDLATGTITLKDLELTGTPYGIIANGSANIDKKLPQSANAVLVCTHCLPMIDDMAAYAARLQRTVIYFAPEKAAAFSIPPGEADAFKKFLVALSPPTQDASDQTTLHFTLISDPAKGPTINGKNIGEIMMLANQYLGPYMKPPTVTVAPPATQPAH